uniref:Src homology 2 domain containing transforming protein D, b n=1 Tax=Nothobranchius kadleci TaxID=1051664 RepID=A0A1A8DM34_NOTKA
MAKWLKDYLSFGRKVPPQPPTPDYTESDILKAYRLQRDLDFEDPYEDAEIRSRGESGTFEPSTPLYGSPMKSSSVDVKSPKHRLIKVDSQELGRTKILLSSISLEDQQEPVVPSAPLAGDTDYSDPFDARLDHRADADLGPVPCENNGYMEPYEAQRVITELQRAPGGRSRGGVQLYDTPYEDERGQRLGYVYADLHEENKESSRLPQDDERPADEYDQPWEWKKERISKAFAVEIKVIKDLPWPPPVGQLNASLPPTEELESPSLTAQPSPGQTSCDQHQHVQFDEKSRMSPTKDGKSRPPQRHSSGCLVNTKMTSLDHSSSSLGKRVDPMMPLESQFWYHGAISRTDAESLLSLCKEASYLVRNSETSKNDFSLSLKSSQGFMHMKLARTKENKYILGQNSCPFDSVPEIIHFYSSRKLPIKGAEHMSLLYPVAIRTL